MKGTKTNNQGIYKQVKVNRKKEENKKKVKHEAKEEFPK